MRRAVVTGLGVVAPTGIGVEAFWAATLKGASGLGRIEHFDPSAYPSTLAGEVRDFDLGGRLSSRIRVETALMTQYGLVASDLALADAGLQTAEQPEYELSVVTANATGGSEFGQREMQNLYTKGPRAVGAYMAIAWFYAATSGQISIRHGMRGPASVLVSDQAGGLDAMGHARRVIRKGTTFVLAGAADSSFSPSGLVAQLPTGLLSTADDPAEAYLPFDVRANGYVPGEGAGLLVVEELSSAQARGARPYGEIAGYAATFDPAPGSSRGPALEAAIRGALDGAGMPPDEVDVVFADGYGVPPLDLVESRALTAVFGPRPVPVTVPKTATGRMYAAGPAVDVAMALLSIRDGVIPPTIHVSQVAPHAPPGLVLGTPAETPLRTALVVARGHRGFNAAVALRALS